MYYGTIHGLAATADGIDASITWASDLDNWQNLDREIAEGIDWLAENARPGEFILGTLEGIFGDPVKWLLDDTLGLYKAWDIDRNSAWFWAGYATGFTATIIVPFTKVFHAANLVGKTLRFGQFAANASQLFETGVYTADYFLNPETTTPWWAIAINFAPIAATGAGIALNRFRMAGRMLDGVTDATGGIRRSTNAAVDASIQVSKRSGPGVLLNSIGRHTKAALGNAFSLPRPLNSNSAFGRFFRDATGFTGGIRRKIYDIGNNFGVIACFTAGTQVLVGYDDDGNAITKAIEDIQAGNFVLARNQHDGTDDLDQQQVMRVFEKTSDHLQIVTLIDEQGNVETIQTTEEHPFWIETAVGGQWVSAGSLSAGMILGDADGQGGSQLTVVSSVREEHAAGITVYNFEVAYDHTYFVDDGQDEQAWVWVHNTCRQLTGETNSGMSRLSADWRSQYGPAAMRRHHLIPLQVAKNPNFTSRMQALGFTNAEIKSFVNQQIADIPNVQHIRIHSDGWNGIWGDWLDANPQFDLPQLRAQITNMMRDFDVPRSSLGGPMYGR